MMTEYIEWSFVAAELVAEDRLLEFSTTFRDSSNPGDHAGVVLGHTLARAGYDAKLCLQWLSDAAETMRDSEFATDEDIEEFKHKVAELFTK